MTHTAPEAHYFSRIRRASNRSLLFLATLSLLCMPQAAHAQFRLTEPGADDSVETKVDSKTETKADDEPSKSSPRRFFSFGKKRAASDKAAASEATPDKKRDDRSGQSAQPTDVGRFVEPPVDHSMDDSSDRVLRNAASQKTFGAPAPATTLLPSQPRREAIAQAAAKPREFRLIASEQARPDFSSGPIVRTSASLEDAALRDVCQVGDFCCAVGDRGVMCFSNDRGESWITLATPFDCSLRSVCFLTDKVGWAAGMRTQQGTSDLVAVLMATRNGGESWSLLSDGAESDQNSSLVLAASLPGILHVEYFGLEEAVVVTVPSRTHNGHGTFQTMDGGISWTAIPSDDHSASWLAADFLSTTEGVLGGQNESYATVVGDQSVVVNLPKPTLRAIRGVSLANDNRGWIVGDGAMMLQTENAGVTWNVPSGELPEDFSSIADLRTVTHRDEIVLAAGAPGSFVLRSETGGNNWTLSAIPAHGQLHRLRFITRSTVLAVGSFGQILKSDDAGISWSNVRSAGFRAGLLNLVTNSRDASWRLLAQTTGDAGLRSAIVQFSQPSMAGAEHAADQWNSQALLAASGLSVCDGGSDWMFARTKPEHHRTSDKLLADWNRQTEGRLRDLLPLRVARELRTWRPSVIVIEPAVNCDSTTDAVAGILQQVLPRAMEIAADPDNAILAMMGLEPWDVERIVCRVSTDRKATLEFTDQDLLPRSGTTIGLICDAVTANLARDSARDSETLRHESKAGYEIVFDRQDATSVRQLLDRVDGVNDSSARRNVSIISREQQEKLQAIIQSAQTESSALAGNMHIVGGDGTLIAQLRQIGADVPQSLALRQLQELGALNLQQNNIEGYLAVQQEVTRRFPESFAAREAAEILLMYYSSAETRRFRMQGLLDSENGAGKSSGSLSSSQNLPPGITASRAFTPNATSQFDALNELWDNHAATAYRLLTTVPVSSATIHQKTFDAITPQETQAALNPVCQLRQAANLRNAGLTGEHSTLLSELSRASTPLDLFARTEMQITHGASVPEIPLYNIPRRAIRPFLDAQLADPIWEAAEEIRLQPVRRTGTADSNAGLSNSDEPTSLVMIASDEEHLYVAGVFEYSDSTANRIVKATHRTHDAKHEGRDRFELEIDTDRDYSTAFHLCIDESGLTSDRCWLLDQWNPQWFVDVKRDSSSWRFEAAIPLAELALEQPRLGTVWGIRLRRIQPGERQHELAAVAGTVSTNGTGLIRFIRPRAGARTAISN